jgi:hypothetical protein
MIGAGCGSAQHGGARIVLIGPQVDNTQGADDGVRNSGANDCYVAIVEGLFSRSLLVDQLGAADPSIEPDVVMLHNADVYMPYWRRTLAELLQMQSKPQCTCTCITFTHESDGERGCPHANCRRAVTGPVVLTVYCEYEVHKVDRMLNWAELEFTESDFAEC